MTSSIQRTEPKDIKNSVLACLTSSPEERRQTEIKLERWEESRRQGTRLCEKIARRLKEKGGLKFRSNLDRLYFDDTFSFEALKRSAGKNSDKLDVWIRIRPRNVDQSDDVQPNLLDATATFEIGDQSRELKLDVLGECVLEGLEPGVICRFVGLDAPSFAGQGEKPAQNKEIETLQKALDSAVDAAETPNKDGKITSNICATKRSISRFPVNRSTHRFVVTAMALVCCLGVTLLYNHRFTSRFIQDNDGKEVMEPREACEYCVPCEIPHTPFGTEVFVNDYTLDHDDSSIPVLYFEQFDSNTVFNDLCHIEKKHVAYKARFFKFFVEIKRFVEGTFLTEGQFLTLEKRCALEVLCADGQQLEEEIELTNKELSTKTRLLVEEIRFDVTEGSVKNEERHNDEMGRLLFTNEERTSGKERLIEEIYLLAKERLAEEERLTKFLAKVKLFVEENEQVKKYFATSQTARRITEEIRLIEEERFRENRCIHSLLEDIKYGFVWKENVEDYLTKADYYIEETYLVKEDNFAEIFVNSERFARLRGLFKDSTPNIPRQAGNYPGERRELDIAGIQCGFCWIPSGTFVPGTGNDDEDNSLFDKERRNVRAPYGFWMLETPVTQGLWTAVMGRNPGYFCTTGNYAQEVDGIATTDFPVEGVNWRDCQIFIKRLNSCILASSDMTFRLPTEAEWEYACRAGTETAYCFGDALSKDKANYLVDCDSYKTAREEPDLERPCAVKSYEANLWGLYDVHGNVWEWCSDSYGDWETTEDPILIMLNERVVRGGGWNSNVESCRSGNCGHCIQTNRLDNLGFRFVLSFR